MKRLIAALLCVFMLFIPVSAFADGTGNINNGGGGMGNGTKGNIWHGDDGVRVTVIRISDNKPVSRPIDLTNYNESNVNTFFVQKSKLHYRSGSLLEAGSGTYKSYRPEKAMPKIISDSGNANISAIRSYFTDRQVLKSIARLIGTTYEKLTDGKYKLLLEPVAYFYFQGYKYAMSATEAAKYDEALSGGLRRKMVSLTHQQLPLSMFLERADMGYPAFPGKGESTTKPQSDTTIINKLGLGIVKFSNDSSGDGGTDTATYRCNTDVVTSVILNSDSDIYPNKPAKVTFHVLGHSYTLTDIVIPAGESQLVWVKWHTPSTPQKVAIPVTSSKGNLSDDEVTANVVKLEEKTPPDPTATDRNDGFKTPDVPSKKQSLANSWSVWSAKWIPNWQWHENWVWHEHKSWKSGGEWVDNGKWVDDGKWEYTDNTYRASLSADMKLMQPEKKLTDFGKRLAYTRKEKGLMQKQLAELIGVKPNTVSCWELDIHYPDVSMIQKILKALKLPEDWFENDDNFKGHDIKPVKKLTKEQQKLVIDNEYIIYCVLKKYNLTPFQEEMWDLGQIGLCKAAQHWNEKRGQSFFTVAFDYIQWEFNTEGRKDLKNLFPKMSLDQPINKDDGGNQLSSLIPSPDDEFEQLEYKILLESVYQKVERVLSPKEKAAFKLWLRGKKSIEVSKIMGVCPQTASDFILMAKNKCRTYFNADEIFA